MTRGAWAHQSNREVARRKQRREAIRMFIQRISRNAESDSRSLSPPKQPRGCEKDVHWKPNKKRNEQIILTGFRERSEEGFSVKIVVKLQLAAQAEESNERSFFIVKNKKKLFANLKAIAREVQANKSIRWMPWHQEPKKDVTNCDKLRRAVNKLRPADFRIGEPLKRRA